MLVVRPVTEQDVDCLVLLAGQAGFGLTGLPNDRELLQERVAASRDAVAKAATKPGGESYLFVMEDLRGGRVVGTSGIVSKVGGFEPFYSYTVETQVRESEVLNVRKEVRILSLVALHSGPCEIGSLFVAPEYRMHGNGRLMSLCRFLFMAGNPRGFDPLVIAEMRGLSDDSGRSPFWEAVGRHFFDIDFPKADYLTMKNKRFIAELFPTHPLYVSLLPQEAQRAIGEVHERSRAALTILEEEGFSRSGMVDIFDAGPVVSCPLAEIRTVKSSVTSRVAEIAAEEERSAVHLIGVEGKEFRACVGSVSAVPGGGVRITAATAAALSLGQGDGIRYAPLYPAIRKMSVEEQAEKGIDERREEPLHRPSVA